MTIKLFTLDNQFIKEMDEWLYDSTFTGIIIWNGAKEYFLNGETHNLNGPALEWSNLSNGNDVYYIHGEPIYNATPESFKLLVNIMKLKGLV